MRNSQQNSVRSSTNDWISLIRPPNSLMVGFAVVIGIAVSSAAGQQIHNILSFRSLLGFVTGFTISSFSMITNDFYDYEVDKINQPERAVASGRISLAAIKIYAFPFLLAGLIAAFLVGPINLGIAVLFALIGWYYNFQGKKLGLAGNTLVALSLAIPYIFGSVSIGNYGLNLAYLLALTSFLAGLGREVLKGISDIPGDKIRNVRSVSISRGVGTAKAVSASLFFLAVISSSFPILAGVLGRGLPEYAVLVFVTDAVFCYIAWKTLKIKVEIESLQLKKIALAGMMLGLLAYLIAGLAR